MLQYCKTVSQFMSLLLLILSYLIVSALLVKQRGWRDVSNIVCISNGKSNVHHMIYTKPDTAYAVEVVSQYIRNLSQEYWNIVKMILRYIKGFIDVALCYEDRT